MKGAVTWAILACFLIGIPMFYIGHLLEKTQRLMNFFKEKDSQSKLGSRLCWSGMAVFALGFALLYFVFPKL